MLRCLLASQTPREEIFMMNIRNILIGFVVSAVLVGVASCGGGGGGSDSVVPTYTVGGNITGATGTVVLKLNGGSDTPMAAAGPFTFPSGLVAGSTYNVQVAAPNQRCTVTSGAGTMGAANISNVAVTCGAQTTQMVIRSAVLNGAQEGSRSTATGVGGVIVDPTNTDVNGAVLITGGITFSGFTPTTGGHHIHQAPIGNPTGIGGVIIGLTLASDGQTAIVPSGARLTPAQYAALLAGELYFNVHSNNPLCGPVDTPTACTGGEIRGQINAQGGVLAGAAAMNFAQEVVAPADVNCTSSTATGQGTLIVDRATRTILISYMTHDVVNVSASHIHTSPTGPGSNGGVIIGFTTGSALSYPAVFGAQMTPLNITDFLANYLYFNIHSNPKCPGGEIRGNITALQ
jgi:hypothetical protein